MAGQKSYGAFEDSITLRAASPFWGRARSLGFESQRGTGRVNPRATSSGRRMPRAALCRRAAPELPAFQKHPHRRGRLVSTHKRASMLRPAPMFRAGRGLGRNIPVGPATTDTLSDRLAPVLFVRCGGVLTKSCPILLRNLIEPGEPSL